MPSHYQCARCGAVNQKVGSSDRREYCKPCQDLNWIDEFRFLFAMGEPLSRFIAVFGKPSKVEQRLRRAGMPALAADWTRYARPPLAICGQPTSGRHACRNETRDPSGRCPKHRQEVAA